MSSQELLELLGKQGPAPTLPAWIEAWNRENALNRWEIVVLRFG